jgi:hypothetical protein
MPKYLITFQNSDDFTINADDIDNLKHKLSKMIENGHVYSKFKAINLKTMEEKILKIEKPINTNSNID